MQKNKTEGFIDLLSEYEKCLFKFLKSLDQIMWISASRLWGNNNMFAVYNTDGSISIGHIWKQIK